MFDKIKKLFTKEEVISVPVIIEPAKKTRKAKVVKGPLTEGATRANVKKSTPLTKPTSPPPKASRKKKEEPVIDTSEKDKATAAGEPYVQVIGIELNSDNLSEGSFELDFNDIFVVRLLKSGYQGKTDNDIVDQWFKSICKNVFSETYEQEMADPEKRSRSNRKDLGNGKAEIS